MARGDECKAAKVKTIDFGVPSKYVIQALGVAGSGVLPAFQTHMKPYDSGAIAKSQPPPKKVEEKKSYGAWGPLYKNKDNFLNMHNC